jgi:hypothetical protein
MPRRAFARPGLLLAAFLGGTTLFLIGRPERACRSCRLAAPPLASERPEAPAPAPLRTIVFFQDRRTGHMVGTMDPALGQKWLRGEHLDGVTVQVVPVDHLPR